MVYQALTDVKETITAAFAKLVAKTVHDLKIAPNRVEHPKLFLVPGPSHGKNRRCLCCSDQQHVNVLRWGRSCCVSWNCRRLQWGSVRIRHCDKNEALFSVRKAPQTTDTRLIEVRRTFAKRVTFEAVDGKQGMADCATSADLRHCGDLC